MKPHDKHNYKSTQFTQSYSSHKQVLSHTTCFQKIQHRSSLVSK